MEALTEAWLSLDYDKFKEVFYKHKDNSNVNREYIYENFNRFMDNPCAQFNHLDSNNRKNFCVNLNLWWEQYQGNLVK